LSQLTEFICLGAKPGEFWAGRPVFLGPNSILPVIGSNEVTPGISNYGNVEFSQSGKHISSIAIGIREGISRIVYASVNATAHVSGIQVSITE
jgi:hypothetical protein